MPRTGKCPNYAGCLFAARNESVTLSPDAAFVCPECGQPLVESTGHRPKVIPVLILGGISLLIIMGAGAVYFQVRHLKEKQVAGQIGTSFEQAEIAAAHGEFMPSRHMAAATPAPTPPVVRAYTQFSPGDTLELVQVQLGLNDHEVRYRNSMPGGQMGMVYFLDDGNLHIDAKKIGETWVILSVPFLEPSTIPTADRVADWDHAADSQNLRSKSQR